MGLLKTPEEAGAVTYGFDTASANPNPAGRVIVEEADPRILEGLPGLPVGDCEGVIRAHRRSRR